MHDRDVLASGPPQHRSDVHQPALIWTLALLSTAGYGALYYAQPLLAVATEHATGWSRAQTSLAFTLALLTNAALAPAVGRTVDRCGGRALISGGAALGAVALILMSLHPTYPGFVVCWVLAGVAMTLTFYEPVFTVVAQQFKADDRRRATLTITLIAGLASTIFVPLTSAGLQVGGLTVALGMLVGLLLITAGLGWMVLPRVRRATTTERRVVAPFAPDAAFRQLILSFTLARIVSVGTGLQLAPLLLARGGTGTCDRAHGPDGAGSPARPGAVRAAAQRSRHSAADRCAVRAALGMCRAKAHPRDGCVCITCHSSSVRAPGI